jgi:hypothetical protein
LPLRLGATFSYPLWRELRKGAGLGLEWPGDPQKVCPWSSSPFSTVLYRIQTVALREPYFGEAEPADHHQIWSQEELNRAVTEAHSSGWQV